MTVINVAIWIDEATTNPMLFSDVELEGYTEKEITDTDRAHLNIPLFVVDETTTAEDVIGITRSPVLYDEVVTLWVDHTAGELNVQTASGQVKKIALLP